MPAYLYTCNHAGTYLTWQKLLVQMDNNVEAASRLVAKRRTEMKGTSTDRNDGEETFLYFDPQKRTLKTRSLDALMHCERHNQKSCGYFATPGEGANFDNRLRGVMIDGAACRR